MSDKIMVPRVRADIMVNGGFASRFAADSVGMLCGKPHLVPGLRPVTVSPADAGFAALSAPAIGFADRASSGPAREKRTTRGKSTTRTGEIESTVIPASSGFSLVGIPITRSKIEDRLDDINLLLTSCQPFSAIFGIKNLSSDLRSEVDVRKTISVEDYLNYQKRIDKMVFDAGERCICNKRK